MTTFGTLSWGRVLRRLVELELVDGGAALGGRVQVDDVSRSNAVVALRVDDQPVLVLKRPGLAVDHQDPGCEERAYEWLAGLAGDSLGPSLLAVVDGHLVIEAVQDAQPLHAALAATGGPRLLEDLGVLLGRVHAAADGEGLRPRRPWALDLVVGRLPPWLEGDRAIDGIVDAVMAEHALCSVHEAFRACWRPEVPMHGDVKFDNVLVGRTGGNPRHRLVLVDWELAGLGLAAWDLAGIVDGLLVPTVAEAGAGAVFDALDGAAAAIATHRRSCGGGAAPGSDELAAAVVVRLTQTAIQLLASRHEQAAAADLGWVVLDAARALAEVWASPTEVLAS